MVKVYKNEWKNGLNYSLKTVSLKKILFKNDTYFHRYSLEDEMLFKSIKKRGILMPPLLAEDGDKFTIISGFKRLNCLRILKEPFVSALTIPEGAVKPRDTFLIALENNNTSLTDFDKCIALHKAQKRFCFNKEMLRCVVAPLIGLDPSLKVIEEHVSVIKLIPALKELLFKNELNFRSALILAHFSSNIQKVLHSKVLQYCYFSVSELKIFCDSMNSTLKRERISLNSFLDTKEIKALLDKGNISKRERGMRFIGYLRERNYPYLTKLRESFAQIKRELSFNKNIRLEEPPYFEEEFFNICMFFSSINELKDELDCVNNNLTTLKKLFDLNKTLKF